jgi:hypothetical protein
MADKELTLALLKAREWIKIRGVLVQVSQEYSPDGIGRFHVDFMTTNMDSQQRLGQLIYQNVMPYSPTKETELWIIKVD